jgi:hypothetical protein
MADERVNMMAAKVLAEADQLDGGAGRAVD